MSKHVNALIDAHNGDCPVCTGSPHSGSLCAACEYEHTLWMLDVLAADVARWEAMRAQGVMLQPLRSTRRLTDVG